MCGLVFFIFSKGCFVVNAVEGFWGFRNRFERSGYCRKIGEVLGRVFGRRVFKWLFRF